MGATDRPAVVYVYAADREAERPITHLAGFAGILQFHGYGLTSLADRGDGQLALCWRTYGDASTNSLRPGPATIALATRLNLCDALVREPSKVPSYLEFFAGGGMVRAGLGGRWKCQFANDFDPLKVQVYVDNWGDREIHHGDIHKVDVAELGRRADLAWASFPCQDLSTAGNGLGLGDATGRDRTRSGTFWAFIDLMKDLKANNRLPRIVVLENVVGLLTINGGEEFKAVISALDRLGMRAGAAVIDARHFVPQSRPRVFIVAVSKAARVADTLVRDGPHPLWHPAPLVKAVAKLSGQCREQWMWLNLGAPPELKKTLNKIVKDKPVGVEWHTPAETKRLLGMMSDAHKQKLADATKSGRRVVGTLSLRMRPSSGKTVQRTEVCFRGLAGCLRTPKGGGSRPRIVVVKGGKVRTRLLGPAEAAALMGLKPQYQLPEMYEYAFRVIGDGVAVPVVSFLRGKLLTPLLRSIKNPRAGGVSKKRRVNRVSADSSRRNQLELRV